MRLLSAKPIRGASAMLFGVTLVGLSACSSPSKVSSENDRLREENMDLKDDVAAKQGRIDELGVRVDQLNKQLAGKLDPLPSGVRDPMCTSLT